MEVFEERRDGNIANKQKVERKHEQKEDHKKPGVR